MYLITAKYSSDSERKRIEYALEKWRERLQISRPEGIVVLADGKDIDDLALELFSKVDKKNVSLYRVEKMELDVARGEKEIRAKVKEKVASLERLLSFIMARQKAILKMELAEPRQRIYEVITKKGKAEVTVALLESESGTNLRVRISGYGEVVDLLHRKLTDELSLLEEAK